MPHRRSTSVVGTSIAAIETYIRLPEYGIAFDMGCCPTNSIDIGHVFLTHGHVDHCGAVAAHASLRALNDLPAAEYIAPTVMMPGLERVFAAYDELGGFVLPRSLRPTGVGDEIAIRKDLVVRAFATDHRVPSVGYIVVEQKERLDARFADLSGPEIARIRSEGQRVTHTVETPVVAVSGDTRIEAIERNEIALRARVLILEATYLTSDQPVSKARERGHIHLDEIIERADLFHNDEIVLTHFSARYSKSDVRRILGERLPDSLKGRVRPLV